MKKFNFSTLVKLAGTALLAFGLSGCPTTYNMGTAKTLGAGEMEFDSTIVYQGIDVEALITGEPGTVVGIPFVDFGFRYGIADIMDVGISVKGFGKAGIDFKVNLLDTDAISLSVDPEFSGFTSETTELDANGDEITETGGLLQIDLPVLVDFKLDEDLTLTLAAKYTAYMNMGDDGGMSHFLGGTLGLDIKVSEDFAIHPFAGVTYWVEAPLGIDVIMPHAGIGSRTLF